MFDMQQRLLSWPLKLHWAGWEATTYSLQQAGWQLSAQQDVTRGAIRIAMKHAGHQCFGLTAMMDFNFMTALSGVGDMPNITIPVQAMAQRMMIQLHETASLTAFKPIDATPQIAAYKVTTLDDFAHFAPPLVRTTEIILPEEDVPAMLARILELQKPAKTEYLKQKLAEDRTGMHIDAMPQQKFHAQILSIAA